MVPPPGMDADRKDPIIGSPSRDDAHHSPVFTTATSAPTWEEGILVGSGRVGAVAHGPADAITVSLAHERWFPPVNPRPHAPDLRPRIDAIRRALLDGDPDTATAELMAGARDSGYGDDLVWTDPLGICATVVIRTPGGVAGTRRTMDPVGGESAIAWTDLAGGRHALRLLAPRDGEACWLALESDRETEAVVELGLGAGDASALVTGGPDASAAVRATVAGGARGILTAEARAGDAALRTVTAVDAGDPGSAWEVDGGSARATVRTGPGATRLLRLAVATGPAAADPTPDGPPEPVSAWDDLRAAQRATHGALVGASALDLGGATPAGDGADPTTEDLWAAARAGDPAARRRVVEVAYLSGRAAIVSSTGELPATLQGVWQGTWRPAWSADYTLNGNVQNGGIASLIPTGTPELARSLLELVLPHLDDFRENARRVYGAEGMLLPARMSTHGRADHFDADYPMPFWQGCGGWILRVAADLVATTGDRGIVDDRLWELARGVLRFAETATVMVDGVRRLVPSYSPENTPGGERVPAATDATMDVAILRDAARATALLGRARGDSSLDARWAAVVRDLPPYRVADDGTLAEWLDPRWPERIAHRHASQLHPLGDEADPAFVGDGDAAVRLRAAAARTVAAKIAWRAEDPTASPGRMVMAFGLVQVGLAAAVLGDGASALTCVEWLAVDHWSPTLTTRHDAGRLFNLDASGGLPALVAAMLLGSDAASLAVLPALPAAWARGSVSGLRARGGLVVDRLDWDPEGASLVVRRVPGAEWLAPADGTTLRLPRAATVRVDGREHDADERIAFGTRPFRIELRWLPEPVP
ncbi:glycoside hydrolase N-terminal domain-containing protein [Clavibacter sp. VKM Ac-2873]|uniref:glycosyl hydrolase family 95 catalytic domain-containing protein n=1 Tax=Clavibacter sp. VKM Ac-2873 TaxID=2783813 RepID=UPI00188D2169|nr:glycoside hydrolase N-terminal domain-containing protein [Clavibacter sp. VKM Ac-2873]MBF4618600.1 glycoside hydrolase N-terminal domain-containing protein [Clavibacter sp. VKM Ac-2873]